MDLLGIWRVSNYFACDGLWWASYKGKHKYKARKSLPDLWAFIVLILTMIKFNTFLWITRTKVKWAPQFCECSVLSHLFTFPVFTLGNEVNIITHFMSQIVVSSLIICDIKHYILTRTYYVNYDWYLTWHAVLTSLESWWQCHLW